MLQNNVYKNETHTIAAITTDGIGGVGVRRNFRIDPRRDADDPLLLPLRG